MAKAIVFLIQLGTVLGLAAFVGSILYVLAKAL